MGESRLSNKLYTAATRRLRERFAEEFQDILADEYEKAGLTYKRRLSADERAEQERQKAIAKARAKQAAAEAELASLLGDAEMTDALAGLGEAAMTGALTGVADAEVIPGSRPMPMGAVHPVDPDALAEFDEAVAKQS